MRERKVHCLDIFSNLQQGVPIKEVIEELQALADAAKKKRLKDVRVVLGHRDNVADLTPEPLPRSVRLFVIGDK